MKLTSCQTTRCYAFCLCMVRQECKNTKWTIYPTGLPEVYIDLTMNVSQLKPSNGFIERRSLMVRMSFTFRPIATAANHCLHWAFLDLHTGTAQKHQGWAKACPSAVIFLAHLEPPSSASGDCQRIWLWLVSWWYLIWFYLGLHQNMLLPIPMDFFSIIQSEIGHQF